MRRPRLLRKARAPLSERECGAPTADAGFCQRMNFGNEFERQGALLICSTARGISATQAMTMENQIMWCIVGCLGGCQPMR